MTLCSPASRFQKPDGPIKMILKYLGRRLLLTIPVLFGITLLAFLLGVLSPGNPAEIALSGGGEYAVTEKQISSIEEEMGLDKSYPAQYLSWIRGVLKGDWGTSLDVYKRQAMVPVWERDV